MTKLNTDTIPFVERTDINEFFRDHPVIKDLHEAILRCVASPEITTRMRMLRIFNVAYCLCTIATDSKGDIDMVDNVNRQNIQRGCMSYAYGVAWALLKLHDGLDGISVPDKFIEHFFERSRRSDITAELQMVIRKYGGDRFDKPINFSGIRSKESKAKSEPSLTELMANAQGVMKSLFDRAQMEIDSLKQQLAKSEEERRREAESHQAAMSALVSENQRFQRCFKDMNKEMEMLREKASHPIIHNVHHEVIKEVPVIKEVSVVKEDPISKALNLDKICDYAKGLPEESDANVVSTMVLTLCSKGDVPSANYWPQLEDIKKDREVKKQKKQKQQSATQFILKAESGSRIKAYDIHDNDNIDRSIIE